MGLAESVFGTPGTQNWIKSGGSQASPGYDFAKSFFSWLPSLMQQQYPTYQGQLDPGMSPTLADAIRRSQGFAQSGPAEILQGVQGTLGNFLSPNFLNPWNAMTTQPNNYGGANMNQRVYGGQTAGSYGGFGGNPGMGAPAGPWGQPPGIKPLGGSSAMPSGGGGQGFAAGEPTPGGGGFTPSQPRPGGVSYGGGSGGMVPPLGQGGPGVGGSMGGGAGSGSGGAVGQPGGFNQAINMGFGDAQKALAQQFQGNAQGLNSALSSQYGMNQFGQQNDGRGQFMHSTDHLSALSRILGREPTFDEVQQSLRSGPGAIEQARSLFQQDDPTGRADWGAGQSAYGKLVDQYGLAKGGQMFEQQFGNGPMWAGGQPGGAPSSIPPLGGGNPGGSGPIIDPSQLPGAGSGVTLSRPGSPAPTPATGVPPLGASSGGGAPTAMPSSPISSAPGTPRPATPMGGGIPPLGSGGPVDVGVAKPIGGGRPGGVVNVRPNRPGSTDQTPRPLGKPAVGLPGQIYNPRTGNWHTPGAGKKRLSLATSP